jgi:VanZ family protein
MVSQRSDHISRTMPFTLNRDRVMTTLARAVAWLLLAAATFLTLSPPTLRPDTGVERHLEHFLAFIFVGAMFAFGYRRRRLAMALVGIAIVGALETLQLGVPGRHGTVGDFVVNAFGVCCGLAAAALLQRIATAYCASARR